MGYRQAALRRGGSWRRWRPEAISGGFIGLWPYICGGRNAGGGRGGPIASGDGARLGGKGKSAEDDRDGAMRYRPDAMAAWEGKER